MIYGLIIKRNWLIVTIDPVGFVYTTSQPNGKLAPESKKCVFINILKDQNVA